MKSRTRRVGRLRDRKPFLVLWMPLLAWMGTLWVLSDQAHLGPAARLWGLVEGDKIVHGMAYAVLAWLTYRLTASRHVPLVYRAPVFAAVLCAILYGLADELHQAYVPGRDASVWDVAADGVGACAVGLFLILWTDRPRGPSRVGEFLHHRPGTRPSHPRVPARVED